MSETCMPDGQWSMPARHKASPYWAQAETRKSETEAEAEVRMPKKAALFRARTGTKCLKI